MALTNEVSPRKFQEAVHRGFKRMDNFRKARLMFLQEYVGSYYDKASGDIGQRPLNMIFNAVRVLIPTMVMNFPKHFVMTPYLAAREYATLLGLALDQHDMKINIRDTYRAGIVDALFTLGVLKTGLCESDSVLALDDLEGHIDPGTVYTEKVDFDNFVVDPASREHMYRDAAFMGDRITVPRRVLLESGLYNNDLVMRMPSAADNTDRQKQAKAMSMRSIDVAENAELEDDVEIVELWVPSAKAIVTIPGDDSINFEDYLRIDDYYGPDKGPYSLLALTPPVPGNPMPVPMVANWFDLAVKANEMAKKIIEQASRQKDVTAYKRSAATDAEELRTAGDGDSVAVDDPDGVKVISYGGQQNSNDSHLASLQAWFNMMAGNPEQVGGQRVDAKSATAAQILQQNAGVVLEDMKDQVYQWAADEAGRRAWYFHTDPLMQMPLTRRQQTPGQPMIGAGGQMFTAPAQQQDVQVILTPEARRGDFLDFTFRIEPESMGRVDSKVRVQQMQQLFQQILPAVMAAAQMSMAMGIGFSPKAALLRAAKDMGIEWFDEVFNDPEFQQQMMQQMMMGPQAQDSKGQAGPPHQPNPMNAILQNGQPGSVQGDPPSQGMQQNQFAQAGSEDAQRMVKAAMAHAFSPSAGKPPLANANIF
jgi:hypothetical protein